MQLINRYCVALRKLADSSDRFFTASTTLLLIGLSFLRFEKVLPLISVGFCVCILEGGRREAKE